MSNNDLDRRCGRHVQPQLPGNVVHPGRVQRYAASINCGDQAPGPPPVRWRFTVMVPWVSQPGQSVGFVVRDSMGGLYRAKMGWA